MLYHFRIGASLTLNLNKKVKRYNRKQAQSYLLFHFFIDVSAKKQYNVNVNQIGGKNNNNFD